MPKKPLEPKDFPLRGKECAIVKNDGKPIAEAENSEMADEISERLNTDEARNEDDRWA